MEDMASVNDSADRSRFLPSRGDGVYSQTRTRLSTLSLPEAPNILRKQPSLRRASSLKRRDSGRSMHAGSIKSLVYRPPLVFHELYNVLHCPVPTSGSPTGALADRFQAWRQIIKDLMMTFGDLIAYNDQRIKSLSKLIEMSGHDDSATCLLKSGELGMAINIIRVHHKNAIVDMKKARDLELEAQTSLASLRADLGVKIKEIKNLSSDFKNSVEKEMNSTRRAVSALQEEIGHAELDPALSTGKQDPYLLRLAVDRQVWRQLEEENYLHQAYKNLEKSGRELESIVVGEIQKAYVAFSRILTTEGDTAYTSVESLRRGPLSVPTSQQWNDFVQSSAHLVDPSLPMRTPDLIYYPGQNHPSCREVRAGLLERKSKYLKSYTAGW
jgi:hypothetical protein